MFPISTCRWYQEELPALLKERGKDVYLLHSELVKLMKWKLSRGKFRPNLIQYVLSNPEGLVKQCTTSGIKYIHDDLSLALKHICK